MSHEALNFILIAAAFMTLAQRTAPISFLDEKSFSPFIKKVFKYIPVSVISAMLVSEFLSTPNKFADGMITPHSVATIIAFASAILTESFLITIAASIGCLVSMQWLGL